MNYKYILSVLFLYYVFLTNLGSQIEDCLSVPPGGFSGFWHYISKLKKHKVKNEKYYCASSGCLAIISNYIDIHKVYNFASLGRNYNNGLAEIKNSFITSIVNEINFIPNITIVTMTNYGTCIERIAKNKRQLKTLLIKTTDIPFLVSTRNEIDGGLCYYYMNRCKKNIKLPITYRFIINLFNFDLSFDDIKFFYNYI
jgi:hypothetical protein